jgi:cytoskeletal protein CcmA (bactofilin family)
MALFGGKSGGAGDAKRRRFFETPEIDTRKESTTVLASSLVLEGDLLAAGDAVVAGRVAGNLEVKGRLALLKGSRVQGAVAAKEARIEGAVEGPVYVDDKLEVGQTARLEGDLNAGKIAIAEGAIVRGSLNSTTEPHRFVEKRQE